MIWFFSWSYLICALIVPMHFHLHIGHSWQLMIRGILISMLMVCPILSCLTDKFCCLISLWTLLIIYICCRLYSDFDVDTDGKIFIWQVRGYDYCSKRLWIPSTAMFNMPIIFLCFKNISFVGYLQASFYWWRAPSCFNKTD